MMSPPDATRGAGGRTTRSLAGRAPPDYVPVSSLGPGTAPLGGFVRNTDFFRLVVTAAGVADKVPASERAAAALPAFAY
jgi:hypothetical protein